MNTWYKATVTKVQPHLSYGYVRGQVVGFSITSRELTTEQRNSLAAKPELLAELENQVTVYPGNGYAIRKLTQEQAAECLKSWRKDGQLVPMECQDRFNQAYQCALND